MALLDQVQPVLRKLGIEVQEFGPDTIAIQAFPSFLHRLSPRAFVQELLEQRRERAARSARRGTAARGAGHDGVQGGRKGRRPADAQEIEALLAHRHLVDRSSNCPHGRPTTLKLSLKDLEKQFKRTGF